MEQPGEPDHKSGYAAKNTRVADRILMPDENRGYECNDYCPDHLGAHLGGEVAA